MAEVEGHACLPLCKQAKLLSQQRKRVTKTVGTGKRSVPCPLVCARFLSLLPQVSLSPSYCGVHLLVPTLTAALSAYIGNPCFQQAYVFLFYLLNLYLSETERNEEQRRR